MLNALIRAGLVLVMIVGAASCSFFDRSDSAFSMIESIPSSDIEARDQLFVSFTVENWVDSNWYVFNSYENMYAMSNEEADIFVSRIFYSPDRKKMVCWVVFKTPNARTIEVYNKEKPWVNRMCPHGQDTVYDSVPLIGFRDHVDQMWRIYPYDVYYVTCAESVEQIEMYMSKYFFGVMKDDVVSVAKEFLDSNYGGRVRYDQEEDQLKLGARIHKYLIGKEFGYNLQDSNYWEKSLSWQKGARIPGLYNFQTTGNAHLQIEGDYEQTPPQIEYPERIKKLYSVH